MELPVITTNWSGPTSYLTDSNSFKLNIESNLIKVDSKQIAQYGFFDHSIYIYMRKDNISNFLS
jgi:hypothetical protein